MAQFSERPLCLFIGTVTKDILMSVQEAPRSDQRIQGTKVVSASGGPASTAAAAYAELGGRASLIAPTGQDANADFVRTDLEQIGLETVRLPAFDAATSFSVILVEENGKRCIAHYGGCMEYLTPEMLDPELLRSADLIHLGGMTGKQAVVFAAHCRKHTNAVLSVDGGNLDGESLDQLAALVDILIPDNKTVEKDYGLSPEAACARFQELGTKIACVTSGPDGCFALCDGQSYRVPACPVSVVDTTGAGDNFHGAFLYAYSRNWPLERVLQFACAYASLTCTAIGGRTARPGLTRTQEEMRRVYGV